MYENTVLETTLQFSEIEQFHFLQESVQNAHFFRGLQAVVDVRTDSQLTRMFIQWSKQNSNISV